MIRSPWLAEHFAGPGAADAPVAACWSGPVDRSKSGLPVFGRLGGRRDVVFGVGFSGNGVGPSAPGRKDPGLARPRAERRMVAVRPG